MIDVAVGDDLARDLEEEFDRQFIESLAAIQMPEEAVDFVVRALKESHHDKMEYRDRVVSELESELKKLESRLDAMYLDKLDGKVSAAYYDKKHREWRRQIDAEQTERRALINIIEARRGN